MDVKERRCHIKRKKNLKDYFTVGRLFKRELKKELRFLLTATFGFTIAFTWRQTIFDMSQSFVRFLTRIENNTVSSILASTFITLVSLILIYLASYYLKDSLDNY